MSAEPTDSAPASKTYTGSCHCGANKFSTVISPPFDAEGGNVTDCNCSICASRGYLLAFSKDADVTWIAGGFKDMKAYKFGKERIEHYFCPTCGAGIACASIDPALFPGMVAWNVRVFDDVDVSKLTIKSHDGKSH
jgi:hypothetical protein